MNRLRLSFVLALIASCSVVLSHPHRRRPSLPSSRQLSGRGQCSSHNTDFVYSSDGWIPINQDGNTYQFNSEGMQMLLVAPDSYNRLKEKDTGKAPFRQTSLTAHACNF